MEKYTVISQIPLWLILKVQREEQCTMSLQTKDLKSLAALKLAVV